MDVAGDLARWTLVAVFAASGVLKVREPRAAADAIVHFGVTRRPSVRLGVALGAGELAAAAALAAGAFADVGLARTSAVPATALLLSFSVLVGRALVRGQRFPCACLGGSENLSGWTLARAAGLAAAGVAVAADPGRPAMREHLAATVIATAVVATIALAAATRRVLRTAAHAPIGVTR